MILVLCPSVRHLFAGYFRGLRPVGHFTQALAFTSHFSLAALPVILQGAREGLGIPDEVSDFYFPFATSIFLVGGCMAQMVGICFLATFYGVFTPGPQLAGIAVSAVAVRLAASREFPVEGSCVMAPILASAGIPLGGIAITCGRRESGHV